MYICLSYRKWDNLPDWDRWSDPLGPYESIEEAKRNLEYTSDPFTFENNHYTYFGVYDWVDDADEIYPEECHGHTYRDFCWIVKVDDVKIPD